MTSEEAVRRYLSYLADPSAVRDDDRITDLEQRLGETADPIEKIKLASELYRAQNVDGTEYREAFVAEAKSWAQENGIVSEAFLQLGVPVDDLRDAGFDVGRRPRGGDRAGSSNGRSRAPRVSVEEIRETALRVSGPFTVSELRALVGGTPATVRKALDGLLEDGRLVDLGPDRNWSGRGRSPHLYRRA